MTLRGGASEVGVRAGERPPELALFCKDFLRFCIELRIK